MIGRALKLIRVLNDQNLTETAKVLNISAGYLSYIENGKKQPTIQFINKFSKFYKVPPSSIMFFSEDLGKSKIKKNIRAAIIKFLEMIEDGKP